MSVAPLVTIFTDKSGGRINAARAMDLTELERVIRAAPGAATKDALPLLKLASFGSERTQRKSLRHDANVRTITGVAGDYDGEKVPMSHAAETLSALSLAALFYTSASHQIVDPPRTHTAVRAGASSSRLHARSTAHQKNSTSSIGTGWVC